MESTTRANAADLGSPPVSGVGESVPLLRTSKPGNSVAEEQIRYTKRRLPHFEKPWATYAVTASTRNRRILSPPVRTIVLNALIHFHFKRYELFAACVMPDHVHFLFQPWPKDQDANPTFWKISDLFHSLKSFTAHRINKLEKTKGPVWEEETFDRLIRSEADLHEKFQYICKNPWIAGLVGPTEDYPWLWTWQDDLGSGSTPVSGVGESVPLSPTSDERSFRRDAETNARDGRAPRNAPISSIPRGRAT
jgi:putative transposase